MPPKRSATAGVSAAKSRSSTGNSTLGRSASGKGGVAASKSLSTGQKSIVSGLGRAVNRSESNASSSNGYTSEPAISRDYSQEELEKVKHLPELDVDDPSWDPYWEVVQEKMGMPESKPIHSEGLDRVQLMLRVFDLDPTFGPAIGLTRLQRWKRAKALGDDPPDEVRAILETKQGTLDLSENIFIGTGI